MTKHHLIWKKFPVLNDGFICLVDYMGDDSRIVQAARTSYGKDERQSNVFSICQNILKDQPSKLHSVKFSHKDMAYLGYLENGDIRKIPQSQYILECQKEKEKDRRLVRRLMMDGHTSPFEKVKFEFLVRVPMDCWRQWIRHRTADVNEYSTRYSEAIDSQQTTNPNEWRLQAKDNKQGSSGYLENWPEGFNKSDLPYVPGTSVIDMTPGEYLSRSESYYNSITTEIYKSRLALGVAREQARKDLPLSTYTEAYWGCSLHNIFNFLRLRMDEHAQLEIRLYANAMAEIIKQVVPVAWEAFEDYILYGQRFSRMEMEVIKELFVRYTDSVPDFSKHDKPDSMTDNEWAKFLKKLS